MHYNQIYYTHYTCSGKKSNHSIFRNWFTNFALMFKNIAI